jgi:hypothetical protein
MLVINLYEYNELVQSYIVCHLRLNNVNQCYASLRDLQLTISENYFIGNDIQMSNSYNCLGVAYQLSGKCELAIHA